MVYIPYYAVIIGTVYLCSYNKVYIQKPLLSFNMVFKDTVSDDKLIQALIECKDEATIQAECVAKRVGLSTRQTRERLTRLAKENKIHSRQVGTGYGYRPLDTK